MNYNLIKSIITANTSISEDEIFDYELSPYRNEFDAAFTFYQEVLHRHNHLDIEPSYVFYKNNFSVNAIATKQNGIGLIGIHMATLVHLIKRYKERTDLLIDTGNNKFIEFEKQLNTPINELIYQLSCHFTFYHEMAHLVQKSEFLVEELSEINDASEEFSQRHHVLEIDADRFSSLYLARHLIQYVKDNIELNEIKINRDQLENLLVIFCSSAFFYLLSFPTNNMEIYYESHKHPHPAVRISIIVHDILSYTIRWFVNDGNPIDLKTSSVLKKCLEFANAISITKFNDSSIERYTEIIRSEVNNFDGYLKRIDAFPMDETLAIYKWNISADGFDVDKALDIT